MLCICSRHKEHQYLWICCSDYNCWVFEWTQPNKNRCEHQTKGEDGLHIFRKSVQINKKQKKNNKTAVGKGEQEAKKKNKTAVGKREKSHERLKSLKSEYNFKSK